MKLTLKASVPARETSLSNGRFARSWFARSWFARSWFARSWFARSWFAFSWISCSWLACAALTGAWGTRISSPCFAADEEPENRLFVRRAYPKIGIYGHFGFDVGEFRKPGALAIGPDGIVAVSDLEAYNVIVFDRQGRAKMSIDQAGPTVITPGQQSPRTGNAKKTPQGKYPPNALMRPLGLAYDRAGNLLVTEESANRVLKFDPAGKLVTQYGGAGSQPGRFRHPRGIYVHTDGRVFVADYENFRVQIFDSDFRYIEELKWSASPRHPGAPGDVCVDYEDNIWIVFPTLHRLVKLDPTGKPLVEVGGLGSSIMEFRQPKYVTCDINGEVFVTDYDNHRVSHFDKMGRYVFTYGFRGNNRGQFKRPMGIDVSDRGSIYIADSDNFRYQVLRIDPMLGDMNLAELAYRRNDLKKALELYRGVLRQSPYEKIALDRTLEISTKLADVARVAEDFEGMQTHLNTILEFEPSNKRARQLDRWIIWRDNKDWIYKSTLVLGLLLTGIFLVGFIIRLMREG